MSGEDTRGERAAWFWVTPVRLGILLSLTDGPAYGYAIHRRPQDVTEGAWTVHSSSVYLGPRYVKKERVVVPAAVSREGADSRRHYFKHTVRGRQLVAEAIPVLRGLLDLVDYGET